MSFTKASYSTVKKTLCITNYRYINIFHTEQNIRLFRHSAYIAHSPNINIAWKRKEKKKNIVNSKVLLNIE